MIKKKVKQYLVEVDGISQGRFPTRKEARAFAIDYDANKVINSVDIIKENIVQIIVKSYAPKVTKVLMIDDLDDNLFEEEMEGA